MGAPASEQMDRICYSSCCLLLPPAHPLSACAEPVVIDVLWGKVATKVGTFLAKSMNLVHTFPHGPQIVKL
jgi:hypothetical protein